MKAGIVNGIVLLVFSLGYIGYAGFGKENKGEVLAEISQNRTGLIIPHHLAAEQLIRTGLETLSQESPRPGLVILMVPNHQEVGNAPAVTGQLVSDREITMLCGQRLLNLPFVRLNNAVVAQERAVTDIVPFITSYFPDSALIPLVISNRLREADLNKLVESLQACSDTVVVAAIDFSHYLPTREADERDVITKQLIETNDYGRLRRLGNEHLDAPATLVTFLQVMERWGLQTISWLAQGNSGRMLGDETGATTSYYVALWY